MKIKMDIYDKEQERWTDFIIAHLTGEISDSDEALLLDWIKKSEKNGEFFCEISRAWNLSRMSDYDSNFKWQSSYELFRQRVSTHEQKGKRVPLWHNLYFKIAACAAIFIPALLLLYLSFRHLPQSAIVEEETDTLWSEVTVPYGSKTSFKLQEGTLVWLNSGSQIRYSSDYGKQSRTVFLNGEAYFDVAKNAECPFIVKAGDIDVKVLGTKFNVQAYQEDMECSVALLQGSVNMNVGGEEIMLLPRDKACYNTSTKEVALAHNATDFAIDWVRNKITFNGDTFEKIVKTLERNYNVSINIHNEKIKKRKFVGDFVNGETIEQVLNVMSTGKMFEYKIKGNVIDLY